MVVLGSLMQTILQRLGLLEYVTVWQQMQKLTAVRDKTTADEIWIVEHYPVYTLGLNGNIEHLLIRDNIPVIKTDRGGQITYHGPGQCIIYLLLDLKRLKINIRSIITIIEQAMIVALSQYGIKATTKPKTPGVYVKHKKIGFVGLRVKRNYCYHGLSLNNNMDLSPFKNINPCGYPNLEITQLADFNVTIATHELSASIVHQIRLAIN